jgi:hypothetical protein
MDYKAIFESLNNAYDVDEMSRKAKLVSKKTTELYKKIAKAKKISQRDIDELLQAGYVSSFLYGRISAISEMAKSSDESLDYIG